MAMYTIMNTKRDKADLGVDEPSSSFAISVLSICSDGAAVGYFVGDEVGLIDMYT